MGGAQSFVGETAGVNVVKGGKSTKKLKKKPDHCAGKYVPRTLGG